MTIQNDNTGWLVIASIVILTLAVPLLIRFFAKRRATVNKPLAPVPLKLTSRPCPPAIGTIGSIICLIFPGTAIIIFGCIGRESQFPDGRWPLILFGGCFILAGLQILRVSVFQRAEHGVGSQIMAAMMFFAFSALMFAGAKHVDAKGEQTEVGGLVHDMLTWLGYGTNGMESPRIGRIVCLGLATVAVIGGLSFLYRIIRRNRN